MLTKEQKQAIDAWHAWLRDPANPVMREMRAEIAHAEARERALLRAVSPPRPPRSERWPEERSTSEGAVPA